MATSLAPREQTGRAVGLIQAAQILAAAVGPLVGGYLADAIGVTAHLPRDLGPLWLRGPSRGGLLRRRPAARAGSPGFGRQPLVRGRAAAARRSRPPRGPVPRQLRGPLVHPDPAPAPGAAGRACFPAGFGDGRAHLRVLGRGRALRHRPRTGQPKALTAAPPGGEPAVRGRDRRCPWPSCRSFPAFLLLAVLLGSRREGPSPSATRSEG